MTKFRIYEIAKEINVDSKEIVSFLKGRNIAVKSNLSSVDEGVRQTVLKEMGRKGNGPKAPQKVQAPQQSSGQPKERVAPKAAPVHPAQPAQKDQQREDRPLFHKSVVHGEKAPFRVEGDTAGRKKATQWLLHHCVAKNSLIL